MNFKRLSFVLLVSLVMTLLTLASGELAAIALSAASHNSRPVADAGPDQTAEVGEIVLLDGSASSDPDRDRLRYCWSLISRPPRSRARILNSLNARARLCVDRVGEYIVKLVVSDGRRESHPDFVRITVGVSNRAPVAVADNAITTQNTAVIIDALANDIDADGDALTITSLSSPLNGCAIIENNKILYTPNQDFTGQDNFTYTISDRHLCDTAATTVTVGDDNQPPSANAGPDQTAPVGTTAQLDGSASSDPDGDALTFQWAVLSQPSGSLAALSDPTAINPTFVLDLPGDYVIQLTVNDGTTDSAPDTVLISTVNSPPVANAGPDQTVFVTDTVTLDGSASTDVDGDPLTFQWSFVSRPSGSMAAISDPAAVSPVFVADLPGDYIVQLIVNDGLIDSAPDTVTISTQNSAPVANAGPDQTVALAAIVQLDGSGSGDPDGDPLTFTWSLLSTPQGSAAALSDPTAPNPTFVADLAGSYIAQLIVSDGTLESAPDTVVISTENSAPAADAGPDREVTTGETVQLDGSASADPDGSPLQFTWSLTTRPPGSGATISDPMVANPTFVADIAGVYIAQLIVSDGALVSEPDTVVITAAGIPLVNVVATDGNAAEEDSDIATFTFTRTGDTTSPLTISYTIGGTATNGADYSMIADTVTIPADENSTVITITPADDALAEGDETVMLTLIDGAAYDVGLPDTATITITDNDLPIVTLAATDAQAAEAGPDTGTFTFARSGTIDAPLQVTFAIAGTANNGLDYISIPASITIPAGSADAILTVTPIADASVEGDETVIVTLTANPAYTVGSPDTATVTITDLPLPVVTITATDNDAAESGQDTAAFTVTRTGPTGNPLTVNYTITGTAINGVDYATIPVSLTIPTGAASAAIIITPIDDSIFELPESVILTLDANAEYTVDPPGLASVTIADNDTRITVVVTDSIATENSTDTGTFTVSRMGPTENELTVFYTVNGSATNGTDYVTLSENVIIPTGSTTATVTVTPIDDALFEGPESVILTISPDASYTVGVPGAATVTITDDERPTVTLSATDNLAGEAGPDTGTFTVTRTGPITAPLTVNYAVAGSAANGVDYQTLSGSVIIPAGSATSVITITPIDDDLVEGAESVLLTITASPDYAVGTPGIALLNIADDDISQVTVTATDPVATEAGPTTGAFTFTRTGDTTSALTVFFTRSGTAQVGGGAPDIPNLGSSVIIPAGESSASVTITPLQDNLVEGDETVILTINPNLSYVVGTPDRATVTIVDDPAIVNITATDADASEAGLNPGVFIFTRAGGNIAASLTIGLSRTGTAGNNVDFAIISGLVTIPANQTSATVTITPLPDNNVEGDETVILTINPNLNYLIGASNTAMVTIADDPAVVTVLATDAEASEAGPDTGVFTFTRSGGNLGASLTVLVSRGGTATNGSDYASLGGSNFLVTIPANETSATVTITPLADNLVENAETVIVTIQPTSSYLIGTQNAATVTIADDPPVLSVRATNADASEAGPDPGLSTFTRGGGNLAGQKQRHGSARWKRASV